MKILFYLIILNILFSFSIYSQQGQEYKCKAGNGVELCVEDVSQGPIIDEFFIENVQTLEAGVGKYSQKNYSENLTKNEALQNSFLKIISYNNEAIVSVSSVAMRDKIDVNNVNVHSAFIYYRLSTNSTCGEVKYSNIEYNNDTVIVMIDPILFSGIRCSSSSSFLGSSLFFL